MDERRRSLGGVLEVVRGLEWVPGAIIDVGVSVGTEGLYDVWPGVPICLVDPVEENRVYMEQIAAKYPKVSIYNVGASNCTGESIGRVMLANGQAVLGSPARKPGWEGRSFRTMTVDDIVVDADLKPPYLLKIDTDTHEGEILEGAAKTLGQTDLCVIEAGIYNGLKGKFTPDALWRTMYGHGFMLFDIVNIGYNSHEGIARNLDLAFAKPGGAIIRAAFERAGRKPPHKLLARQKQREAAKALNPYI